MKTWTSHDGRAEVSVHCSGRDTERRPRYSYAFTLDGVLLHGGTDLSGGCDAYPDEYDALRSLSSFVSAWDESKDHPGSENADLFPDSMHPWVDEYADEFWCDNNMEE